MIDVVAASLNKETQELSVALELESLSTFEIHGSELIQYLKRYFYMALQCVLYTSNVICTSFENLLDGSKDIYGNNIMDGLELSDNVIDTGMKMGKKRD